MRVLLMLLALMLSGCLGAGPDEPLDGADGSDGDGAGPASGAVRLLAEQHAEGMFPAAEPGLGAFEHVHAIPVPEGAERVVVYYNATYTGMWPSYAFLNDPSGESRDDSGAACEIPFLSPQALQAISCTFEARVHDAVGPWAFSMHWQAGETVEEYALDVQVWGR